MLSAPDAAHAAIACAVAPSPSAACRPETEGSPQTLRRLPWLWVVPRRHHEVRPIAAAVGAAEPQVDQRHVTAPGLHEAVQFGLRLVLATTTSSMRR